LTLSNDAGRGASTICTLSLYPNLDAQLRKNPAQHDNAAERFAQPGLQSGASTFARKLKKEESYEIF
jgi:hypothetical protein